MFLKVLIVNPLILPLLDNLPQDTTVATLRRLPQLDRHLKPSAELNVIVAETLKGTSEEVLIDANIDALKQDGALQNVESGPNETSFYS